MKKYKDVKVLIVDDVANMRSFLAASLRSIDILKVWDASNVKDGMKLYQDKKPDIVFLDLDMPGIGGMTMLRSLTKQDACAYVVIVSGESKVDNVKEALKAGAKGFIVKPYNMNKIILMLDKMLASKG